MLHYTVILMYTEKIQCSDEFCCNFPVFYYPIKPNAQYENFLNLMGIIA